VAGKAAFILDHVASADMTVHVFPAVEFQDIAPGTDKPVRFAVKGEPVMPVQVLVARLPVGEIRREPRIALPEKLVRNIAIYAIVPEILAIMLGEKPGVRHHP